MGYPQGIDELTDDELRHELNRRMELRTKGRCDYCERDAQSPPCRFPERHKMAWSASVENQIEQANALVSVTLEAVNRLRDTIRRLKKLKEDCNAENTS